MKDKERKQDLKIFHLRVLNIVRMCVESVDLFAHCQPDLEKVKSN